MRMNNKPDKNYLFGILSYNAENGLFTWLESRGTVAIGCIAGARSTSRGKTYIYIKIDKRLYKAHHLAWLFHHREWPTFDLDHIDGDGTNNRIANLRKCSMSENKANSKIYKNNKSGFKGVSFHKRSKKWIAYININKKRTNLGSFDKAEDAAKVYWAAAKKLHGKFARAA